MNTVKICLHFSEKDLRVRPYDAENMKQGFTISDDKIANMNEPETLLEIVDRNNGEGAWIGGNVDNGEDNQRWEIVYV